MAGKSSVKKQTVCVPNDLTEAAQFIREIGQIERNISQINSRLNENISNLTQVATEKVTPHSERQSELLEGLYVFAEARRAELTEDGRKKTVDLPTGTIAWRLTPSAVSLNNLERILALIKELGLIKFIRIKEEIDKEAMLREPEVAKTIKGVTISQKEEFVVKPTESDAEIKKVSKRK